MDSSPLLPRGNSLFSRVPYNKLIRGPGGDYAQPSQGGGTAIGVMKMVRLGLGVAAAALLAAPAFAADLPAYPAAPPPSGSPVYSGTSMVTADISLALGWAGVDNGPLQSDSFSGLAGARANIPFGGGWNEELSVDDDGEYFCRVLLACRGIKYTKDGVSYYRKFNNRPSLSAQKTYYAYKGVLKSTLLKAGYLTAKTSDVRAKAVLSRLLWDNAYNFYPHYKDLATIAEKHARELLPGFRFNPFKKGLNFWIVSVFGWKFFKRLQYLKYKIKAGF